VISFGVFAIIKLNFNYFGHCCNYVTTIDNFILWDRWFLNLFSFMNRLICPINHNSHQLVAPLEIFYHHLGVYFYVCIRIVLKIYYPCDFFSYFLFENFYLNLKIHIQDLKTEI